ncbi:hypothetical protein NVIE_2388 [Nitrososphaera viennensis EN76]|uniref:Uncharacterized protein n=1 Tax=Nitrososphaera viennensis EN76 TaxID=926571 RepID=A0A060HU08_9ARCH|nr:hypothetical protein NVIE_2388 [Nitrososphaera viennensis EN76]
MSAQGTRGIWVMLVRHGKYIGVLRCKALGSSVPKLILLSRQKSKVQERL